MMYDACKDPKCDWAKVPEEPDMEFEPGKTMVVDDDKLEPLHGNLRVTFLSGTKVEYE
jgi:hypothetical protein